jgi:drug/metabolite transporter (DMT)-like permease
VLLGGLIFVAYFLQTEGLARTTATNAGFITVLYIVFTPIVASVVFGHRTPASAWLPIAVGFAGLALLSVRSLGSVRVHGGDLLVLAGAVAWAGHIAAVGRFSPRFPTWVLSLGQMGAAAAFHLSATIGTGIRAGTAVRLSVWPLLFLTGVVGSGIAFTIQIVGQRTLTAARAVILLAGESVFSALFSAIWIGERLSAHQWVGALLVVCAIAWSELRQRRAVVIPAPAPAPPAVPPSTARGSPPGR